MTIKIGILGYGNLGKGVECAVKHNPDMELAAVFTRRDKASLKVLTPGVKVCSVQEAESMKDEIDVMILCGGSRDHAGKSATFPLTITQRCTIILAG